jgi:hypothetical protein
MKHVDQMTMPLLGCGLGPAVSGGAAYASPGPLADTSTSHLLSVKLMPVLPRQNVKPEVPPSTGPGELPRSGSKVRIDRDS